MAKNTRKTAPRKAAKPAAKRAPTRRQAPPPAIRRPAAGDGSTAMYEVLAPFKFGSVVAKPPTSIELTADEAREYQDAGVLGTAQGEVPRQDDGQTNADTPPN